jgi:NADH dehydrogenase
MDTARDRPHVVVLGGGFGGLTAVRALARAPVRITLVDQNNHHLFQPLLYQVATAALATTDVAVPLRHVVRAQANVTVLLARVQALDVAARRVVLEEGELVYDRLIVALGATTHWFGHDEWAAHALSLKDCRDALDVRNRILSSFEAAEHCTAGRDDEARRARLLTFVVIGGGPTGVELAGALAEIARLTLARDFRHFSPASARVVLVVAGERILPAFPPRLAASAQATLVRLGVTVRTRAPVTDIDAHGVTLGAERIDAGTVLWAAGVRASPLLAQLGSPLDRGGRVLVAPDLSLPNRPEVQVIGDAAAVPWKAGLVPGMAPGAMQMGRHAAQNLERALRGEATLPFRYRDKGSLATVGRSSAVAALGRFTFTGFLAWVLWVAVHIAYLIGFHNRFVVLVEWAWLYTTRQRGARVILARGARDRC